MALESQLVELQRAMHAMTNDPANRCRLYLTDREVGASSRKHISLTAADTLQSSGY